MYLIVYSIIVMFHIHIHVFKKCNQSGPCKIWDKTDSRVLINGIT